MARTEAAAGRPGALESWQDAARIEEEALLEWWLSEDRSGAAFDGFRLVLSGVRLALAMDPTLSAAYGREVVMRTLNPD